ncbi:Hypothetical protein NAEGRDRAFT_49586 [Naegleria gruberi]|uniref:F-box domain-containing protein n=1 Tax=Naegleria gruberi TaxID=5762 RepID=D2VHI4_NAEGR|nr:uncharacterized protein NAEGRDRAFT_49586 [Naegleria gruberi]EFC43687.1 Hypothetical protein NAEGRDRAFT_49586 [Naegleria gruberi]|eukprot:XP_002676431.1 Hypothetical protein NAEGRDRAFT_49586 [Naegleria gruberi strain NEG-M]
MAASHEGENSSSERSSHDVHLLNLPIENITSILSFVTLFELIPLARVCKYFHSIILPFDDHQGNQDQDPNDYLLWRNVAYCHFKRPFVDLGRKKRRVERVIDINLKYDVKDVERIKKIIQNTGDYWYNLIIDFDGNDSMVTDYMYLLQTRKLPNLKILRANHVDSSSADVISKVLSMCPVIEELTLKQTGILELELESIKKKTYKTLKRLTVNSSENMLCGPAKGYVVPTDFHFQQLEEVYLSGLTYCDFSTTNTSNPKTIKSTLFKSKKLKKVVMERCNLIFGNWFLSFYPKQIEYLEIRESTNLDIEIIEHILKMKNLKTLIIDIQQTANTEANTEVKSHLSDNIISRIFKELEYLECLDITGDLSSIRGECFQHLRTVNHLTHLVLDSTTPLHMIDYLQENKNTSFLRNSSVQHLFISGDQKFESDELCEELILSYFSEDVLEDYCLEEISTEPKATLNLVNRESVFYDEYNN